MASRTRPHPLFTPNPSAKEWLNQATIWFILSLSIALLYRLPALLTAFSGDYVVQDDARQHVFWMQRFIDPDLFPNDLFADYFQSVAPWGYSMLYRLGVWLGIDPWTFNKLIPLAIALVTTGFAFGIVMELVQLPIAAFVSALFLNQSLMLRDDVVSGTAVAFLYPCFCAWLYFTLRRSWLPSAICIVLLGWFYPQGVLVVGGTLVLMGLGQVRWQCRRLTLVSSWAERRVVVSGLLAAFFVLLPYALKDSAYGPVLSLAQARTMVALSPQGWSDFFVDSPVEFWLFGQRTGLFPARWGTFDLKVQLQIWLTLAIPFLLIWPGRSRLAAKVAPRLWLLLQVAIASVGCYVLAYLFLFQLHLPNRYTEHSFRILVALGTGVATALISDRCRAFRPSRLRALLLMGILSIWAIAPIVEIGLSVARNTNVQFEDSRGNYYQGQFPDLYTYLQSQPKDTVIAGLDSEVNNLPGFTNRSIFIGGKGYALPYHLGYFREVENRSVKLIEAQYSLDPAVVQEFLSQYDIDFWMITPAMFTPEWVQRDPWLLQYSQNLDLTAIAAQTEQPTVIETLAPTCLAAEFTPFLLLDTDCLRSQLAATSE